MLGCGGGGESPPAACVPVDVTITIVGDSTALGLYQNGTLRQIIAQRFPVGVTVLNGAIGGTTAEDLLVGRMGFQAWPVGIVGRATENHGINDARHGVTVAQYEANLREIMKKKPDTILVTPSPMDVSVVSSIGTVDDSQHAAAMRQVAKDTGAVLIDVNAYVLARPNWQAELPDGVHPGEALYSALGRDVYAPVLIREIAPLRCQ